PAVSRQRSVRLLEHGSAHVLESDLDALLPGQHSGLGRDVLGRMIDDMMGAQGAGTLELLGTAGGGDDVGAEPASDLDRRASHAASGADDETILAGPEPGAPDQH